MAVKFSGNAFRNFTNYELEFYLQNAPIGNGWTVGPQGVGANLDFWFDSVHLMSAASPFPVIVNQAPDNPPNIMIPPVPAGVFWDHDNRYAPHVPAYVLSYGPLTGPDRFIYFDNF